MRLTRFTDYALRTLIYLGAQEPRQASIAGIAGNVGQTNYATSKAGVIGLVDSWRDGLENGITVVTDEAPVAEADGAPAPAPAEDAGDV